MCIMSAEQSAEWQAARHAIEVSQTRLFGRRDGDVQYLIYQMAVTASSDLAMVLPLPVAHVADDAVQFIDLSGAPNLFDDLSALFPSAIPVGRGIAMQSLSVSKSIAVQSIGSFEASYVPTLADMTRLDPRFRISDEIWNQLPQYARFGFAVFKLKHGEHEIHPMGMKFESCEPTIFFPTVHVHDGELHDEATFDHMIYVQASDRPTPDRWTRVQDASDAVRIARTHGAVADGVPLYRFQLAGRLENTDTRVALT